MCLPNNSVWASDSQSAEAAPVVASGVTSQRLQPGGCGGWGLGSLENHSRNLPTGHEDVSWDTEAESEGSLDRTEDDSGSSWFCSESALPFCLHLSPPVSRSFTEDNLCQDTSVHISGNVALGAQGRGFTGMVNSWCELRPWGRKNQWKREKSGGLGRAHPCYKFEVLITFC